VDVYFGPKPPCGKEKNWVQAVPGKGWNTILRLYGPLDPADPRLRLAYVPSHGFCSRISGTVLSILSCAFG
jgi:hypothetical protein